VGSSTHLTEELAMSDTILAIELGKYKSVACLYDPAAAEADFRTFDTSRAELTRLIVRARPAVVVIEACTLSGWVHDLCGELGVRCRVANTAAEAWKYKHTRRKTDRDDALRLAQLAALGQLPEVVVPAKRVREWRVLIAHPAVPNRPTTVSARADGSRTGSRRPAMFRWICWKNGSPIASGPWRRRRC
jgi:hypothetical protein